MKVAKRGGSVAKGARDLYEKETGKTAISSDNTLNYKYVEKNLIESKQCKEIIKNIKKTMRYNKKMI